MEECIACTYSGRDEQMYAAHGCPACTCITDEERAMLDYFHNDKGSLTNWCGWESFKKKRPDVAKAYDEYRERIQYAELNFKRILESL